MVDRSNVNNGGLRRCGTHYGRRENFHFFVLIIGIGMIAIPSGLVASALSKVRDSEQ